MLFIVSNITRYYRVMLFYVLRNLWCNDELLLSLDAARRDELESYYLGFHLQGRISWILKGTDIGADNVTAEVGSCTDHRHMDWSQRDEVTDGGSKSSAIAKTDDKGVYERRVRTRC